ncbi:carcinoembryonic antigen-related cell adhesion molecule 5-like isoform X1 [Oreochromis niloticus]|uniref:carcinoembryonic antigen-related cell adhesion molecule 5-like isoform X1 n=1 Tax=Oreochromis niloticus TaxID=8128 RepID=UPI0009054F26|nr:carcinoembryonic antigen-related cell adhesion molecule 5-like isoform X1 [Oreochromis niloticus]
MALLPQLFIVIMAFEGFTEGVGVLPDGPLIAAVGETVKFNTTLTPTGPPFPTATWILNDSIIIISSTNINDNGPEYEGRVTLFPSTGSLELRNLVLDDSGAYSVTIVPGGAGRTMLVMYEKVSSVLVTSSSTDLVEFSGSVSLSCSASGSSLSFLWFNGSSEVTASDRVQLTDGGSSLTIINVTRSDQGPFKCRVSNPVSTSTSDPVNLSISYGPENIHLILSPSQEYFAVGSDISLTCSVESRPLAQFKWFLNGDQLPDSGSELRLMNVQMSQSGNYSCQAFNSKTLRSQTSHPSAITVLEKISGTSVKPSPNLPVEGTSVNLTCEAVGPVFTRKWMKNNSDLTPTDNMILSDNNRVLTFNSVNRKDNGEYFCQTSNSFSSDGAKYIMIVNYGPEKVQLNGPNKTNIKDTLKLTCSAESTPSARFRWLRNGIEILSNSAEYVREEVELSDSGNYSCQAWNNITERTSSSVVHELTVTEPSSGLSAGAIAGIVIACFVLVAAAAGGGYFFYKKKGPLKKSTNRDTSTTTGGNAASSSQELNYADVSFFPKRNDGRVQMGLQNESSNHAQVQANNRAPAASSLPTYDTHVHQVRRPAPQADPNAAETYAQVRVR